MKGAGNLVGVALVETVEVGLDHAFDGFCVVCHEIWLPMSCFGGVTTTVSEIHRAVDVENLLHDSSTDVANEGGDPV